MVSANVTTSDRTKSLHFTSPSSSGGDSLSNNPRINSTNRTNNNTNCECNDDADDDGEDDDEEEEDGLIPNSSLKSKQKKITSIFTSKCDT